VRGEGEETKTLTSSAGNSKWRHSI